MLNYFQVGICAVRLGNSLGNGIIKIDRFLVIPGFKGLAVRREQVLHENAKKGVVEKLHCWRKLNRQQE